MVEYNIFCYSEQYNDDNSFQQKRYRVFNKEVKEKRYREIENEINRILGDNFRLRLDKEDWEESWKQVTSEQWQKLLEIPEAKDFKKGFECIAGIKIELDKKHKMVIAGEGEDVEINSFTDFINKKIFVRTVTYHLVGKVEKITGKLIELSGASWVADSGRFMNAIKDGTLDEVEPVGKVWVNADSIVDLYIWVHRLPDSQK